jgi:uncharacterized protein (TIGR00290 family)
MNNNTNNNGSNKAFCCLSGGKDSILSFYEAQKYGMDISCFVNMAAKEGKRSRSHGLALECLKAQAEAIGVPLIQGYASWDNYEAEFKRVLSELKDSGINTGIFGDIDLQPHRDWVERVCFETGIKPLLPLWGIGREEIMSHFINSGFEAVVCSVNTDMMGEEWLGRKVDNVFAFELSKSGEIDLCGEKGEYHTFVYNGPIFKRSLDIIIGKKMPRKNGYFLEIEIK